MGSMRATTIHAPGDIRVSEVPTPAVGKPTDAVVRVVAGCICGSALWPYRGENDITPGSTSGHECVGVVEEVGSAVSSFRTGDFVIVPFDHCDNTCAHCRAGVQSACVNLGMTTSGQGEYALVNEAEGSLVKTDGMPDEAAIPSLLALSDVMPTGWDAAVVAGGRGGRRAVVRGACAGPGGGGRAGAPRPPPRARAGRGWGGRGPGGRGAKKGPSWAPPPSPARSSPAGSAPPTWSRRVARRPPRPSRRSPTEWAP